MCIYIYTPIYIYIYIYICTYNSGQIDCRCSSGSFEVGLSYFISSQCAKFPMLKNWLSHGLSLKTRLARCTNGAPKDFSDSK